MSELKRAHHVIKGGAKAGDPTIALDYDQRLLRRKRLATSAGDVLVDLAEVTSLDDGDALQLDGGGQIAVLAAPEPLLQATGDNLPRLAWHVGNRHAPCQILDNALRIKADPVLAKMLEHLGATVEEVTGPFRPEGGAYGHGRTFGHSHGPEEDVGHSHDHGHDHTHEHGHSHDG